MKGSRIMAVMRLPFCIYVAETLCLSYHFHTPSLVVASVPVSQFGRLSASSAPKTLRCDSAGFLSPLPLPGRYARISQRKTPVSRSYYPRGQDSDSETARYSDWRKTETLSTGGSVPEAKRVRCHTNYEAEKIARPHA